MKRPSPQAEEETDTIDARVRLELLYRDERGALVRFFARHRATPSEADDLAQEAFLRFTNAAQSTSPIRQPGAYLRQIGRNLLRNEAKSGQRLSEATDPAVLDLTEGQIDEIARLEARDSLRRIEAALWRLKPKTRAIFFAYRIEGMSYTQIADKLGMSVRGVEKQVAKAALEIGRAVEQRS